MDIKEREMLIEEIVKIKKEMLERNNHRGISNRDLLDTFILIVSTLLRKIH